MVQAAGYMKKTDHRCNVLIELKYTRQKATDVQAMMHDTPSWRMGWTRREEKNG